MKNKPTIIAIVGASGSGKTSLSLYLEENFNIPAICSYTTRPMREGEVNGCEHWFVGPDHEVPKNLLAYTFFGVHHYWTTPGQAMSHKISTYVVDEYGLVELKNKLGDTFKVISVYIERPVNNTDSQRKARDLSRTTLPPETYDVIIRNDRDLKTFYINSIKELSNLISL